MTDGQSSPEQNKGKLKLSDLRRIHEQSAEIINAVSPDTELKKDVEAVQQRRKFLRRVWDKLIPPEKIHSEKLAEAIKMGERDPLTGAYNRVGLNHELVKEIGRLQRMRNQNLDTLDGAKITSSVLLIDVNGLKELNDRQGHIAGDKLLQRVVLVLQEAARINDIVARIGGDEFVVLLAGADPNDAMKFCEERLKSKKINVSIGIAPLNESDPWKSIKAADKAMYRSKKSYRMTDRNEPRIAGRKLSG